MAYTKYAGADRVPMPQDPGLSTTDTLAIGMVAQAAVASWHSFQMDKINYRMQKDAINYKRAAQAESRRHNAAVFAMNRDKLNQALFSERLALQIDQMEGEAKVRNEVNAYNFNAAPSVVRDIQRKSMRQSLYQERTQATQRQQLDISEVDASRSREILYDPIKPDATNQLTTFTTDALKVGHAAYGGFTKGN